MGNYSKNVEGNRKVFTVDYQILFFSQYLWHPVNNSSSSNFFEQLNLDCIFFKYFDSSLLFYCILIGVVYINGQ